MPTNSIIEIFKNAVAKPESGGEMYEKGTKIPKKNRMGSSAQGKYQIIDDTWNNLQKSLGRKLDRTSLQDNEDAMSELTRQNISTLERNKIPVNNATLYAMHFKGDVNFIKTAINNPNMPTNEFFSSDEMRGNPTYLKNKTMGEAFNIISNKVGSNVDNYRLASTPLDYSKKEEPKEKEEESNSDEWMFKSDFNKKSEVKEDDEVVYIEEDETEDNNIEEDDYLGF